MLRRMQKTYQERYIAYWLHNINTLKNKNKVKVQDPALIKSVKSIQVYHKIELIGKKSNYHQNKISYTTLKDIRPIQNTIYIMQTSKGLITSIEAIKHKVGGFIICKISL
jgi:ribosomal protein S8